MEHLVFVQKKIQENTTGLLLLRIAEYDIIIRAVYGNDGTLYLKFLF